MKNKIFKILIISYLSFFVSSFALADDCNWEKQTVQSSYQGMGGTRTDYVCPTGTASCSTCSGEKPQGFLCCSVVAVTAPEPKFKMPDFVFQVPIPGLTKLSTINCTDTCEIPWISEYAFAIYTYGLTIVGVIAVLTLMAAGLLWIVSGGDSGKITKAKEMIAGSITGLLLLVSMNLLLSYINPNLIQKKSLVLDVIKRIETGNEVSEGATTPLFDCMYKEYGASEDEVKKTLTTVNFLGKDYQVNTKMAVSLNTAQQQITAAGITYKSVESGGGAFNWRANKNKPTEQSLHSFGIALDINPTKNPNYESSTRPCKTDMPLELIDILRNNGFRWGGDYKTVCDSMHFEWVKGNAPCTIN